MRVLQCAHRLKVQTTCILDDLLRNVECSLTTRPVRGTLSRHVTEALCGSTRKTKDLSIRLSCSTTSLFALCLRTYFIFLNTGGISRRSPLDYLRFCKHAILTALDTDAITLNVSIMLSRYSDGSNSRCHCHCISVTSGRRCCGMRRGVLTSANKFYTVCILREALSSYVLFVFSYP